jgi:RNA polymerase sigma-70 factor (ECF subfamily)
MNAINTQIREISKTAQLVIRAKAGDRSAFGELFEMYRGSVLAIATRRLGNYSEAQELSQDVFVQAMEKIDQLRQPECFGGWLRSITVRMSINRAIRRAPSISAEPEILAATVADNTTPLDNALGVERSEQLHEGLNRLGVMDREALEAFYVHGQSLIEMAEHFDAPIGTIKRRLHVARKRLAKQVEHLEVV